MINDQNSRMDLTHLGLFSQELVLSIQMYTFVPQSAIANLAKVKQKFLSSNYLLTSHNIDCRSVLKLAEQLGSDSK